MGGYVQSKLLDKWGNIGRDYDGEYLIANSS